MYFLQYVLQLNGKYLNEFKWSMKMGIGFTEFLLIAGIATLFFGGKKIPELGKGMGEAIKNFKQGMREPQQEENKKNT